MKLPKAARLWCSRKRNTGCGAGNWRAHDAHFVPFTAQTRMSGVDLNGFEIRKGRG